jgi:hypothetical protein
MRDAGVDDAVGGMIHKVQFTSNCLAIVTNPFEPLFHRPTLTRAKHGCSLPLMFLRS